MGCGSSVPRPHGLARSESQSAVDEAAAPAEGLTRLRTTSSSKTLRSGIVCAHSVQNESFRPSMEDSHVIVETFGGDKSSLLVGVFDGHGGVAASALAAQLLPAHLGAVFGEPSAGVAKIQAAFLATDAEFTSQAVRYEGTTATVALLTHCAGTPECYIAWLGDSSCVLSRGGVAAMLTDAHNCDRADERERVTAMGGFVARGKVNGLIAVSRCFGDLALKPVLCAEPDVVAITLEPADELLICACDGLWDVCSPQLVVDAARACVASGRFASTAATLCKMALDAGSTDNVSVIVVRLDKCWE